MTIYDVLIILIQCGMPVVGIVIGIFLGKWIEQRNENKKLKREIYLEANRALVRYRDVYLLVSNYTVDENIKRLHEQQMLLENAKSDLEIFGSDKSVELYVQCLESIVLAGQEVLSKKQNGETITNPKKIDSYKTFLTKWSEWNNIVRKDLGLIK